MVIWVCDGRLTIQKPVSNSWFRCNAFRMLMHTTVRMCWKSVRSRCGIANAALPLTLEIAEIAI